MRKLILVCTSLFTMVLSFSASPVQAQSVLWVSATGNDANACSPTAPCATFQGAINKGNVAQINCLNSGNYGSPAMVSGSGVIITASITIDCGAGNIGNIAVSGSGISIQTTSAATVVLRHLSLNGLNAGSEGIDAATQFFGGTLIVEDCTIQGFHNGSGIQFAPGAGRGAPASFQHPNHQQRIRSRSSSLCS